MIKVTDGGLELALRRFKRKCYHKIQESSRQSSFRSKGEERRARRKRAIKRQKNNDEYWRKQYEKKYW